MTKVIEKAKKKSDKCKTYLEKHRKLDIKFLDLLGKVRAPRLSVKMSSMEIY